MSEEFDEFGNPKRWDEFEWEEFMKERDEEASKLARFIEEHKDDPDLDQLMAREMGWFTENPGDAEEEDDFFMDDADDEGEEWKSAAGIEPVDDDRGGLPDFRSDPLYSKAFDFAIDATTWIQELPEALRTDPEIEEAFSLGVMPAAKIANAWDDGADDLDMLGYRIAAYKRGLAAANRSLELMGRIRERKMLDDQRLLALITLATDVRNAIAVRILELRKRFDEG